MPDAVPAVPETRSGPAIAHRGGRRRLPDAAHLPGAAHLHAHAPLRGITVAVGCVWLCVTLWSNLIIGFMTVGFLVGHILEIAAVLLVTVPAALDIKLRRVTPPGRRPDCDRTRSRGEEAYSGAARGALMVQLEQRDVSTEEHTRRAAAEVGEELKLPRHRAPSPGSRRAAALHRQARGAAGDPQQARQDESRRSSATRRMRKLLEELGGFPEPVRAAASSPTTTNGWTARYSRRPAGGPAVRREPHPGCC